MISQEEWDRLDDGARVARLAALARQLPVSVASIAVREHALGNVTRRVGVLSCGEQELVLVPSAEHVVGFDIERGWEPDVDERRSWQDGVEDFGIEISLEEYLARVLRRRRRVEVPAMLVDTRAREVGFRRIDPSDPSVAGLVAEHAGQHGTLTAYEGGRRVRIRAALDGAIEVDVAEPSTHADVLAELARDGARPPTSDEWEYLCDGGAGTLFRWGNHVPMDRYPTDVSPEESAWRRAWVLSAGTLARPAEGFAWSFDLHRRPNAHGLRIAFDPYHFELTTDPLVRRGGDGGSAICGGTGYLLGWLPLASAFVDEAIPGEEISVGYTYVRRCFVLS